MLSKKTQYALKAAAYIAARYSTCPVHIVDIANHKKIPLKFLESILLELKKANILESKKGKGGGYYFPNPPQQVSLATIIRTIEGPIALLPCVSLYFYKKCEDCNETDCHINKVFREARDGILSVLERKTAADIMDGNIEELFQPFSMPSSE